MDLAAWCGLATRDNGALLAQIDVDYARAGSDVITANTFSSSRVMLAAAGHGDDVVELNPARLVRDERAHFDGPMSAYPDSGYFEMPGWRFVDIIEPAVLEGFYAAWMQQRARVLGGCCGLTVPHIEAANRARAAFGA
ncbi:MAG: homocysteine S-methyltransferase family protein [Gaiellales bacterium]|jgi:methionine synthase I (cobalamin-dependent)|nr:homocysteine S-methyltransferase family protein [Gaiellales bacterium]